MQPILTRPAAYPMASCVDVTRTAPGTPAFRRKRAPGDSALHRAEGPVCVCVVGAALVGVGKCVRRAQSDNERRGGEVARRARAGPKCTKQAFTSASLVHILSSILSTWCTWACAGFETCGVCSDSGSRGAYGICPGIIGKSSAQQLDKAWNVARNPHGKHTRLASTAALDVHWSGVFRKRTVKAFCNSPSRPLGHNQLSLPGDLTQRTRRAVEERRKGREGGRRVHRAMARASCEVRISRHLAD